MTVSFLFGLLLFACFANVDSSDANMPSFCQQDYHHDDGNGRTRRTTALLGCCSLRERKAFYPSNILCLRVFGNTPTLSCLLSQNVCSHPALSTSSFMVRRFRTCLLFSIVRLLVFSRTKPTFMRTRFVYFIYPLLLCCLFFSLLHPPTHLYIVSSLLLCVIILYDTINQPTSLFHLTSPLTLAYIRPSTFF